MPVDPRKVEGLLLDIDGVLVSDWQPLPGAVHAVARLRELNVPFRLMTNATMFTRADLASTLAKAGFDFSTDELITAPVATAAFLRSRFPEARCFLLGAAELTEDLEGVRLVEDRADVVVVAGADRGFTWETLSHAFRMLLGGAALVAMHRNLYWLTGGRLALDAGAYITGLEEAAGVKAVVTGKPSRDFFQKGLDALGMRAEQVAMVGDDLESDVLAAQSLGMTGVLVRARGFRSGARGRPSGKPDLVIDSIAELPRGSSARRVRPT